MSIVHEIHNQKPAVRYALFGLALFTTLVFVGFLGVASVQRDMFMALHSDPQEREDFIAQQEDRRPKPIAALARITGALTASIGSLIGWNRDAGFDKSGQRDTMQGGVHLLPLSQ